MTSNILQDMLLEGGMETLISGGMQVLCSLNACTTLI